MTRDGAPEYIYFIKPKGADGPIKIGCSQAPLRRLETIMSWSPIDLEIIVTVPGNMALESNIHDCFANSYRRNEWFNATPSLIAAIDQIKAGIPIDRAIDLTKKEGCVRKRVKRRPFTDSQRKYIGYIHKVRHAVNRAEKASGERRFSPDYVDAIFESWRHYDRPLDKTFYTEPPAADLQRLDEFIANPEKHSASWDVKWPKDAA